jgi:hypothetical protein
MLTEVVASTQSVLAVVITGRPWTGLEHRRANVPKPSRRIRAALEDRRVR